MGKNFKIYHLSPTFKESKTNTNTNTLFGKLMSNNTKFIVDGINVSEIRNMANIINREQRFLVRVENLMNAKMETSTVI